jgi:hypothetical protein
MSTKPGSTLAAIAAAVKGPEERVDWLAGGEPVELESVCELEAAVGVPKR